MAGLGRRSHYRKHLTNSILNDFPEPTPPNQRIAKVVGTRGSNQFEVVLAPEQQQQQDEGNVTSTVVTKNVNWDKTPQLALLPSKFRKLIWVKRNDYVICSCAEDDVEEDEEGDGDSDDDDDDDGSGEERTRSTLEPRGTISSKLIPPTSASTPGGIRYMITHILYKDQVKHLKDVRKWPTDPFFDNDGVTVDGDGSANKKEEMDGIILRAKALAIVNEKEDKRRLKMNGGADEEDKNEIDHTEHLKLRENDSHSGDDNDYDDDYVYDDDLFINTNRIAKMTIDDSSSDESD
eukprot:CAMPEP_0198254372 /NCGR_PEP_ID=MMETSP1447-20131203/4688_1 /TAXON_ID=420782 /ORGANISM="Chaetoceros dichaeta, Strain CCMP1751" /LENGTH=291 /DNA_ID=CAMNT_0043940401 /DNA_START=24 /DNA_END=899 /DNA_ORIENTATION=+